MVANIEWTVINDIHKVLAQRKMRDAPLQQGEEKGGGEVVQDSQKGKNISQVLRNVHACWAGLMAGWLGMPHTCYLP